MPEDGNAHLRIHCVCGQKMKVSSDMYGRPGKCVACRQKIRLPRLEEVPAGATDVYLKDHPEFLRKTKRAPSGRTKIDPEKDGARRKPLDGRRAAKAEEEIALGGVSDSYESVPLSILEPLQTLCSVQYKLERQLTIACDKKNPDREMAAEVEGYLDRIYNVRNDMDEQLRQVLMETAIELASTQEKITHESLSARVGEIDFSDFRDRIHRLRSRRDRLERRQQNVRGWLGVAGPHMAGGFVDLPLESIPEEGFTISVPSESDDSEPLVNAHIASLRDAMEKRAEAERTLTEVDRMSEGDSTAKRGLKEARKDAKAQRRVALANLGFYRARLDKLADDYTSDIETVGAQLDLARGRLQVGDLLRADFDEIEKILLKAKIDAAKAGSLINRTLSANSAQDVPQPRGTFLQRLTFRDADSGIGVDSWLTWSAAAFMVVGTLLPAMEGASLLGAFRTFDLPQGILRLALLGPIFLAVVAAGVAAIPSFIVRGRSTIALWLVFMLAGAWFIRATDHGLDPMSEAFRDGTLWMFRPGIFVLLIANVLLMAAAWLVLMPLEAGRPAAIITTAIGLALGVGILSNGVGYFQPDPVLVVYKDDSAGGEEGARVITVSNQGNATLNLVRRASTAKSAYLYVLEWHFEEGDYAWADVPEHATLDQRVKTLAPGESEVVRISLPPGEYRVTVGSAAFGRELVEEFTIAATAEPTRKTEPARTEHEPPEGKPEPREPGVGGAIEPEEELVEVEFKDIVEYPVARLSGIATGADGALRFMFVIGQPDGTERRYGLSIDDDLAESWHVREYNPNQKTVTISGPDGLVILHTGEAVELSP